MFAELRARAWQIGTFAAGATAVALGVALGVTHMQKAAVIRDRDRMFVAIEAPKTGWRDRLSACNSNVGTLETGITSRNQQIEQMSIDSAQDLAAAEELVAAARRDTAALNTKLNRLQSTPLKGATVCERYEEADRALLELLK